MSAINSFCGTIADFIIDKSGNDELKKGFFSGPKRMAVKGVISFNLKAILYNTATAAGISAIAAAIFGAILPPTALALVCLSLVGRRVIQQGIDESLMGSVYEARIRVDHPNNPVYLFFKEILMD